MDLFIPNRYISYIDPLETVIAVQQLNEYFSSSLSKDLNLQKISAPLIIKQNSGVSDNLNGTRSSVTFQMEEIEKTPLEIIRSITKWKLEALRKLEVNIGKGIFSQIMALRPDDLPSNTHSIQVDQWDWELVISKTDRNIRFLESIVNQIYSLIVKMEKYVNLQFAQITPSLPKKITFLHSVELEKQYPSLTPGQREFEVTREFGAVFIIGIGGNLSNGLPHGIRQSDSDDWSTITEDGFPGLNGDILVWHPLLNRPLEISSMGIRVDSEVLKAQSRQMNDAHILDYPWHRNLLNNKFPASIGGGIGLSRLNMFLLKKVHIGEVQPSVWPREMAEKCNDLGINLL